jgi:hypothetical protein
MTIGPCNQRIAAAVALSGAEGTMRFLPSTGNAPYRIHLFADRQLG